MNDDLEELLRDLDQLADEHEGVEEPITQDRHGRSLREVARRLRVATGRHVRSVGHE